jgi:hypothetical protein
VTIWLLDSLLLIQHKHRCSRFKDLHLLQVTTGFKNSVGFDATSLTLTMLIAEYLSIPHYVRSNGEPIDICAQYSETAFSVPDFALKFPTFFI